MGDEVSGMLSNQRVWSDPGKIPQNVKASATMGAPLYFNFNPDGCCLDEEGCIWSSSPNIGTKKQPGKPRGPHCRLTPDNRVLEVILPPPDMDTIACSLGGEDGKTLFLLEAKHGPGKRVLEDPNTAHIRTIQVDAGAAKDPTDPNYTAGYR